jgi:hypothetical protein
VPRQAEPAVLLERQPAALAVPRQAEREEREEREEQQAQQEPAVKAVRPPPPMRA